MEELLLEWWNAFPRSDSEAPTMSLRNQSNYLLKKYTTQEHKTKHNVQVNGENVVEEIDETLICFKNIICKYRPHLHMGDYWLSIKIIDEQINYRFYAVTEFEEGKQELMDAVHPHLNGGIPCLGSFQGDLATNFKTGNYIQFFSTMKAYLQAYNGRSTYSRGSEYKKLRMYGDMYSYRAVHKMFATEGPDEELNVYGIAEDPMRWNWPKDLTAFNTVVVEGQSTWLIKNYLDRMNYPILKEHRYSLFSGSNGRDNLMNKVIAYVNTAHIIGELPVYQAFEFVRIFLESLRLQYEGELDKKSLKSLEDMAKKLYSTRTDRNYMVNSRYQVMLDDNHFDQAKDLWLNVKEYYVNPYSNTRERDKFGLHLDYLGDHLSNFIILLRKKSPHLAKAKTYMTQVKQVADIDKINKQYNKIKKHAYSLALTQLEKERRRFINELNKPEISNIIDSNGQGTLFSENL